MSYLQLLNRKGFAKENSKKRAPNNGMSSCVHCNSLSLHLKSILEKAHFRCGGAICVSHAACYIYAFDLQNSTYDHLTTFCVFYQLISIEHSPIHTILYTKPSQSHD